MVLIEQKERIGQPVPGIVLLKNGNLEDVYSTIGFIPRVAMRIALHEMRLCSMMACIVPPEENFTISNFRMIAAKATEVNRQIGLATPVTKLVIRTRDKRVGNTARLGGTNPMAIVEGVDGYFPYLLGRNFEGNEVRFPTVSLWKQYGMVGDAYCMVHEEHNEVQKASVHGRYCQTPDGGREISVGKGVSHARAIGDNGSPYLRLFGHQLDFMLNSVLGGRGGLGMGIKTNTDARTIIELAEATYAYSEQLENALQMVDGRFGRGHVLEFRIVRPVGNVRGLVTDNLQIYDADLLLGLGRIGTIGGVRPSPEFLAEMVRERALAT